MAIREPATSRTAPRPKERTGFNTGLLAVLADRLGSAALVLDHTGEVIARDLHAPYGTAAIAWRADHQPGPTYRFTGKEDNTLASAVSIGARQYIPALGRWATPDPQFLLDPEAQLARPGERNLYRYAGNNPTQHIDPTGHGLVSWVVKVGRRIWRGADKADEASSMVEAMARRAPGDAGAEAPARDRPVAVAAAAPSPSSQRTRTPSRNHSEEP